MTLLWAGGAELQSTATTVEFSAIVSNAPAIETSTKRSGNAAWRISNAAAVEGFAQIFTSAQGQFFAQFYLYIVAAPTNAAIAIATARQTGTNKLSIRLTSGLALRLWNEEDSAQVGTDSSALSLNTWYRVAFMYDTTTLASTSVEARAYTDVAGAASFWNPSGTIDITATPNRIFWGIPSADATLDYIVDDCTINDTTATGGPFNWNTWPPENKLVILRPNGNGDNSAWTGSDADSTNNYLLVSEVPPSSTEYVESNTSGQIDDYDLEATPAAIGASDTINAVMVGVYAAVSDATSADPDIALRIKASSGGSVAETGNLDVNSVTFHSPVPLPGNDNYAAIGSESNYEQPGGTTAWTKAALDTMQIGVREVVTDTHLARVAAIWAYVSFTPAVAGGTSYTETGADIWGMVSAGGDVETMADSGSGIAGQLSAGADQQAGIDAGAGLAGAVGAGADQGAFVDGGFAVYGNVSSGADVYTPAGGANNYTETGFAAAGWVSAGADIAGWVDAGAGAVGRVSSGGDVGAGTDSGALVAGWIAAATDVQAMRDSGFGLFGTVASGDYANVDVSPAHHPEYVRSRGAKVGQSDGITRQRARKVR